MKNIYCLSSANELQTRELAAKFAHLLKGGEIIFLRGPIGSGKTVFVQGVADTLKMKSSPTSASFNLMKRYANHKKVLVHIDLFRLGEGELCNLGFEEMLEDEKAIILAEWPDLLSQILPADRLEMDFALCGGDKRKITLRAGGSISAALAEELCKTVNK